MDTKFTPGPWLSEETSVWAVNESGTNRFSLGVHGGFIFQGKNSQERTPVAELDANARLIAAAPDMYEALKGAIALWDKWYPSLPVSAEAEDDEFGAMSKIRALLAKVQP